MQIQPITRTDLLVSYFNILNKLKLGYIAEWRLALRGSPIGGWGVVVVNTETEKII